MINDLLRGKTDEEVSNILSDMSVEELLQTGTNLKDKNIIKYAIEKANTKVWAFDYNSQSADFFNAVNLRSFYYVYSFDDRYIKCKRIADGKDDESTILFFGSRYTPIYKGDKILNDTEEILNKILTLL